MKRFLSGISAGFLFPCLVNAAGIGSAYLEDGDYQTMEGATHLEFNLCEDVSKCECKFEIQVPAGRGWRKTVYTKRLFHEGEDNNPWVTRSKSGDYEISKVPSGDMVISSERDQILIYFPETPQFEEENFSEMGQLSLSGLSHVIFNASATYAPHEAKISTISIDRPVVMLSVLGQVWVGSKPLTNGLWIFSNRGDEISISRYDPLSAGSILDAPVSCSGDFDGFSPSKILEASWDDRDGANNDLERWILCSITGVPKYKEGGAFPKNFELVSAEAQMKKLVQHCLGGADSVLAKSFIETQIESETGILRRMGGKGVISINNILDTIGKLKSVLESIGRILDRPRWETIPHIPPFILQAFSVSPEGGLTTDKIFALKQDGTIEQLVEFKEVQSFEDRVNQFLMDKETMDNALAKSSEYFGAVRACQDVLLKKLNLISAFLDEHDGVTTQMSVAEFVKKQRSEVQAKLDAAFPQAQIDAMLQDLESKRVEHNAAIKAELPSKKALG